ncbi:MAG TPA: hypothetical protein VEP49_15085 [Acidimicrobiia bacterium]|nr:hypothetical protein [Acidimicrobiia bacterium]
MVEAGLDEVDVRAAARAGGLRVWDGPAMPCLSSRLPHGMPVTIERLGRVDRAEEAVRALGFGDVRVRDLDDTARIEVPFADVPAAAVLAAQLTAALTALGYRYVTLDLAGLGSGKHNGALGRAASA